MPVRHVQGNNFHQWECDSCGETVYTAGAEVEDLLERALKPWLVLYALSSPSPAAYFCSRQCVKEWAIAGSSTMDLEGPIGTTHPWTERLRQQDTG